MGLDGFLGRGFWEWVFGKEWRVFGGRERQNKIRDSIVLENSFCEMKTIKVKKPPLSPNSINTKEVTAAQQAKNTETITAEVSDFVGMAGITENNLKRLERKIHKKTTDDDAASSVSGYSVASSLRSDTHGATRQPAGKAPNLAPIAEGEMGVVGTKM